MKIVIRAGTIPRQNCECDANSLRLSEMTVMLRREGWHVNTQCVTDREQGLELRMKNRADRAAQARIPPIYMSGTGSE
jgi:hypothetical protein